MSVDREVTIKITGQVDNSFTASNQQILTALQGLSAQFTILSTNIKTIGDVNTQAFLAMAKAIEQMGNQAKPAATKVKDLGDELKKAKPAADELANSFKQLLSGLGVGLGIAAITREFVNLSKFIVSTGSDFERFQIRLEALSRSFSVGSKQMRDAIELSKSVPFDVKEVVAATVNIEKFGASSRQLLPIVADMAALMGTDLPTAAQNVAKAWEGSVYGIRILRNEYGITTGELRKHGAEVDRQGRLYVTTSEALQKFRDALGEVLSERYLGGAARVNETLSGSFSLLRDAATRFAGVLSNSVNPAVKENVELLRQVLQLGTDIAAGAPKTALGQYFSSGGVFGAVARGAGALSAGVLPGDAAATGAQVDASNKAATDAEKQKSDQAEAFRQEKAAFALASKRPGTPAEALSALRGTYGSEEDLKKAIETARTGLEAGVHDYGKDSAIANSFRQTLQYLTPINELLTKTEGTLAKVADESERWKSIMDFSRQIHDVGNLKKELTEVQGSIGFNKALLQSKGFDVSAQGLATTATDEAGTAAGRLAKDTIKLIQDKNRIQGAIDADYKRGLTETKQDVSDRLSHSKAFEHGDTEAQIKDIDTEIAALKKKGETYDSIDALGVKHHHESEIRERDLSRLVEGLEDKKRNLITKGEEEIADQAIRTTRVLEKQAKKRESVHKQQVQAELNLNKERQKNIDVEIKNLVQKEGFESRIVKLVHERLALEEKAIEDLAEKEREQNHTSQQIAEATQLRRVDALRKAVSQIDAIIGQQQNKLAEIEAKFAPGRFGGAASPFRSAAEESEIAGIGRKGEGFKLPAFSLSIGPDTSELKTERDRFQEAIDQFDKGVSNIKQAADVFLRAANALGGGTGSFRPASAGVAVTAGGIGQNNTVNNEFVTNIEASNLRADERMKSLTTEIVRRGNLHRLRGANYDDFSAPTGGIF